MFSHIEFSCKLVQVVLLVKRFRYTALTREGGTPTLCTECTRIKMVAIFVREPFVDNEYQ